MLDEFFTDCFNSIIGGYPLDCEWAPCFVLSYLIRPKLEAALAVLPAEDLGRADRACNLSSGRSLSQSGECVPVRRARE